MSDASAGKKSKSKKLIFIKIDVKSMDGVENLSPSDIADVEVHCECDGEHMSSVGGPDSMDTLTKPKVNVKRGAFELTLELPKLKHSENAVWHLFFRLRCGCVLECQNLSLTFAFATPIETAAKRANPDKTVSKVTHRCGNDDCALSPSGSVAALGSTSRFNEQDLDSTPIDFEDINSLSIDSVTSSISVSKPNGCPHPEEMDHFPCEALLQVKVACTSALLGRIRLIIELCAPDGPSNVSGKVASQPLDVDAMAADSPVDGAMSFLEFTVTWEDVEPKLRTLFGDDWDPTVCTHFALRPAIFANFWLKGKASWPVSMSLPPGFELAPRSPRSAANTATHLGHNWISSQLQQSRCVCHRETEHRLRRICSQIVKKANLFLGATNVERPITLLPRTEKTRARLLIIGASGSGKSTLANCLLLDSGMLPIDGADYLVPLTITHCDDADIPNLLNPKTSIQLGSAGTRASLSALNLNDSPNRTPPSPTRLALPLSDVIATGEGRCTDALRARQSRGSLSRPELRTRLRFIPEGLPMDVSISLMSTNPDVAFPAEALEDVDAVLLLVSVPVHRLDRTMLECLRSCSRLTNAHQHRIFAALTHAEQMDTEGVADQVNSLTDRLSAALRVEFREANVMVVSPLDALLALKTLGSSASTDEMKAVVRSTLQSPKGSKIKEKIVDAMPTAELLSSSRKGAQDLLDGSGLRDLVRKVFVSLLVETTNASASERLTTTADLMRNLGVRCLSAANAGAPPAGPVSQAGRFATDDNYNSFLDNVVLKVTGDDMVAAHVAVLVQRVCALTSQSPMAVDLPRYPSKRSTSADESPLRNDIISQRDRWAEACALVSSEIDATALTNNPNLEEVEAILDKLADIALTYAAEEITTAVTASIDAMLTECRHRIIASADRAFSDTASGLSSASADLSSSDLPDVTSSPISSPGHSPQVSPREGPLQWSAAAFRPAPKCRPLGQLLDNACDGGVLGALKEGTDASEAQDATASTPAPAVGRGSRGGSRSPPASPRRLSASPDWSDVVEKQWQTRRVTTTEQRVTDVPYEDTITEDVLVPFTHSWTEKIRNGKRKFGLFGPRKKAVINRSWEATRVEKREVTVTKIREETKDEEVEKDIEVPLFTVDVADALHIIADRVQSSAIWATLRDLINGAIEQMKADVMSDSEPFVKDVRRTLDVFGVGDGKNGLRDLAKACEDVVGRLTRSRTSPDSRSEGKVFERSNSFSSRGSSVQMDKLRV